MKKILLSLAIALLVTFLGAAQTSPPKGASNFITEAGGLMSSNNKVDIIQQIAGARIDNVEGGGGVMDWTESGGRVFLRTTWMVEIGKIDEDYGVYDFKQALAAEMQKRLLSERFRLTPKKFNFHYIRYQKGSTQGSVEVRSFFLNSGNLPLRIEFIFNESYRPLRKKR
ncbi:MAG: hypothetical protein WBD27_05745 [Pyrinomonadaceae bacterium]